MDFEKSPCITRREFAKVAAVAAVAFGGALGTALAPTRSAAEEEALVTEFPANAPVIASLGYVNESPKADQNCAGCVLYTGPAEGRGKCALFQQGVVPAKAWCKSWAPKPKG